MRQFIINSIMAISALMIIGFHIWLPEMFLYTFLLVGVYFIAKIEFIPWKIIFYGTSTLLGISFVLYLFYLSPIITLVTISILSIFYFLYRLMGSLFVKILFALLLLAITSIISVAFKNYPPMALGVIASIISLFYIWCFTQIYERVNLHGFYYFIPFIGPYKLQSEINRSVLYKRASIILTILILLCQIVISIEFFPYIIIIFLLLSLILIIFVFYDLITISYKIGFKQSFAIGLIFLHFIFIPIMAMKKNVLELNRID
jgi:hypothetical protein